VSEAISSSIHIRCSSDYDFSGGKGQEYALVVAGTVHQAGELLGFVLCNLKP